MAESSFTGSKLLEAMWIAWNPKALRPKDPGAIAAIDRYVRLYNNLYLGEPFPPRFAATSDDYIPLNIAPAANRSRIDEQPFDGQGWVDLGPNVDLRALKPGRSVMAGVPFDIIDESRNQARSVVMVHNAMFTDRTLPSSVEIPTPDLKTASLLFLHCLDNAPGWNYLRRRELAGFYFIVFEDGTYSKVELKYGTSIGTWDGQNYHWEYAPAGDNMSHANLAWTGQTTAGLTARLFMSEWVNPKPHLNIQKIILRSTHEPSNMNPMLLAVTSIHPKRAAPASSQTLPSASLLLPPKPVGKPVDLSGGVDESELRYVAPDGTVIHAQALNNSLSERTANAQLANEYRSYVGFVTLDGHQAARTDDLRFDFPKPTSLTGVVVTSRFREQRKAANFPPLVFNLFVDVSADAGKTWKEVGSVLNTIAEEHGPVWIPLPSTPVQYVRLRQTRSPDSADYSGFSRVQFYQAP